MRCDVVWRKGLFDNSMMSAVALRNLWRAHHRELRTIPIPPDVALDSYLQEVETMRGAVQRNERNNRGSGKVRGWGRRGGGIG